MPGKINVYNIGKLGVNVDKNPIQIEDGELTKAQNLIRDPMGSDGGVRKRAGLVKINGIAATGSILGAIPVPIAKPTTRTFIYGRYTDDTTSGWNTSTDAFTTSPTTGGPDGYSATATPRAPTKLFTSGYMNQSNRQWALAGRPSVMYRNRFFYAGNDYTIGTTAPSIHVWDGVTDYVLATIPDNPDFAGTTSFSILNMIAANGRIYLSTYDGGSASAGTIKGRVFELNTESGALRQIGARFPIASETARTPYALCWYMGRLFAAASNGSSDTTLVYWIRPDIDTTWTADGGSNPLAEANAGMIVFQGKLYFLGSSHGQTTAALIGARTPLGVYSTTDLTAVSAGTTGFGAYNHFGAAAVFQSNLYVAYWNFSGTSQREAHIYKFDGTSWTIPKAFVVDATDAVPYHGALVHNNILYMWSSPAYNGAGTEVNQLISTVDGTTWVTKDPALLNNNSAAEFGVIVT